MSDKVGDKDDEIQTSGKKTTSDEKTSEIKSETEKRGENPNSPSTAEARNDAKTLEPERPPGTEEAGLADIEEFIRYMVQRIPAMRKQVSRATLLPEHPSPTRQLIVGRLGERNTCYADMPMFAQANQTYRFTKIGAFYHEAVGDRGSSGGVNNNIYMTGDPHADSASNCFRKLTATSVIPTSETYKITYYIYEALRSHFVGWDGLTVAMVQELVLDWFTRAWYWYGTLHAMLFAKYHTGGENTYWIAGLGVPVPVMRDMMIEKLQEYWVPEFVKYLFAYMAPTEYSYSGKVSNDDFILLDIDEIGMAGRAYCGMYGTKWTGETNNYTPLENMTCTIPKIVREQITLMIEMLFLGMSFDQIIAGMANIRGGQKAVDVLYEQVKLLEGQSLIKSLFETFERTVKERNALVTYNMIHGAYPYLKPAGTTTLPNKTVDDYSLQDLISYESGDAIRYREDFFDIGISELDPFRSVWFWMVANVYTSVNGYVAVQKENQGTRYTHLDSSTGVPVVTNIATDAIQWQGSFIRDLYTDNTLTPVMLNSYNLFGSYMSQLPPRNQLSHDRVIKMIRTMLGLSAISKIRIFQKQGIVIVT